MFSSAAVSMFCCNMCHIYNNNVWLVWHREPSIYVISTTFCTKEKFQIINHTMWSWKWQPTSWMAPHFWENLLNFSSSHVITLLRRIIISLLLPGVDFLQDFAVFLTCRYESFDNISKILSWLISRHPSYNLPFPLLVFLCSVFRTMSSALVKGPRYSAHSLKFGLRFNSHMVQPGNACNNFFFQLFPKAMLHFLYLHIYLPHLHH